MNTVHDMGGMDGFGPIEREGHEPVFHADWERRMFALSFGIAVSVGTDDDHFRREVESIPPVAYLKSSYYELWYRACHAMLARNIHPTGHTRLPRYARGKTGTIHANRGVFSFADSKARGDGPAPQHLYTVAFAGEMLWGSSAERNTVYLDLWDHYLDPAPR